MPRCLHSYCCRLTGPVQVGGLRLPRLGGWQLLDKAKPPSTNDAGAILAWAGGGVVQAVRLEVLNSSWCLLYVDGDLKISVPDRPSPYVVPWLTSGQPHVATFTTG